MVMAELKIKCWKCGREEEIKEVLEDCTVEINQDKLCPVCLGSWMTKKELTMKKCDAAQFSYN